MDRRILVVGLVMVAMVAARPSAKKLFKDIALEKVVVRVGSPAKVFASSESVKRMAEVQPAGLLV